MKKAFSIILISLISLCLFAQEKFSTKYGTTISSNNHSYLTEEFLGSEITVTGLLSANKNTFILQENPDSKSMVTFYLEVKKWSLKRKLRKLDGQTVKITGELTEASGTWNKKLKALKVE